MKIAQCLSCYGRKTIVSLGNMQKSCPYCLGIGYLQQPEKELAVTVSDVVVNNTACAKKKKTDVQPILQSY